MEFTKDFTSSNIARFGYDPQEKRLRVIFHSESVYDYHNVPQRIYDGMVTAESKGTYLNTYVKGVYNFQKIM